MIKERYVSLEVARLLKEKGFNEYCRTYYKDNKVQEDCTQPIHWNNVEWESYKILSAPTQQMACDWLQEKHHYIINVHLDVDGEEATTFVWSIYEKINPEGAEPYARLYYEDDEPYDIDYKDDAINDALEYVLKNLI